MKLNYFNFKEFNGEILLTNDMGRYAFVEKEEFRALLASELDMNSDTGKKLSEAGMVYESPAIHFLNKNKWKLAVAKSFLSSATSLHIFVVTTACNMSCVYCQANNGTTIPNFYMDTETAERAVEIALQSPVPDLSFEFQGGEPLLNYEVIKTYLLQCLG